MSTIIKVENLSKLYRLGKVSTGTLKDDLRIAWANLMKKENPFFKIGEENDRTSAIKGDYVWALKDINFSVEQGQVLGIIGKNGAGKSTLLKILSRVTSPSSGSIKVKGRIASLLEVGTGFHPDLTGRENVFLSGAILGMTYSEVKRKFDEIVAFSGVDKYIDTPVKRYSSGMYVRLAFAVSAHLEPEILIIDEVLAVGDLEFQKKCLGKMKDVSGEGRTVLFVSHNMTAIKQLCSNALLLSNGQVAKMGGVDEIVDKYFDIQSNLAQTITIDKRADRQGNGSSKFTSLKINSMESTDLVRVECADTLTIEFIIQNIKSGFSGKVVVGIYDQSDTRIAFLDSEASGMIIKSDSKDFKVTATFPPNVSLGIGKFFLNIALFNNFEMADYVQTAAEIEIVESDFFGSSKTVPIDTKVLIRNTWTFNDGI
ncbi:MAG: ATP-binding cassette domain-containing protein [Bacteroidia bacterium]|nr:ATP-binding cassette domain-containing protein [Bacteroidia bacterium]